MCGQFEIDSKQYPIWLNRKGYACVALEVGGKMRAFLLHRLVWERANGPVPDGHDLHHLDHDKTNWRLDNLAVVERAAHQQYHRDLRFTDKNNKAGNDDVTNSAPNNLPGNGTP